MVVADKLPPTPDKRCGTYAGARAHDRRNEATCDACRRARLAYFRAYNSRRTRDQRDRQNARARVNYAEGREAILDRHSAYWAEYGPKNRDALRERARAQRAAIAEAFAPVAKHSRAPWNAEDDAILRAAADELTTTVAAILRRTPNAVTKRRGVLRKRDRQVAYREATS